MKNENLDANRIEAEEVAEEITESELNEQRQIRREKLKKLQEAGRDPFAVETWNIDAYSQPIKDDFENMEEKQVSVAGRIMAKRDMGKASFIDIQDREGRIQVYVRQDAITPEEYKWFKAWAS